MTFSRGLGVFHNPPLKTVKITLKEAFPVFVFSHVGVGGGQQPTYESVQLLFLPVPCVLNRRGVLD